jgi:hypothetical protein
MCVTLEAVRAEALFVSDVQSSDQPTAEVIRQAVTAALRQHHSRGCALQMAHEFGDHPDLAATRMAWALAMIRATYPNADAPVAGRSLAIAG